MKGGLLGVGPCFQFPVLFCAGFMCWCFLSCAVGRSDHLHLLLSGSSPFPPVCLSPVPMCIRLCVPVLCARSLLWFWSCLFSSSPRWLRLDIWPELQLQVVRSPYGTRYLPGTPVHVPLVVVDPPAHVLRLGIEPTPWRGELVLLASCPVGFRLFLFGWFPSEVLVVLVLLVLLLCLVRSFWIFVCCHLLVEIYPVDVQSSLQGSVCTGIQQQNNRLPPIANVTDLCPENNNYKIINKYKRNWADLCWTQIDCWFWWTVGSAGL